MKNTFSRTEVREFEKIWGFFPIAGGDGSAEFVPVPSAPGVPVPEPTVVPAAPEFSTLVPAEFKDAPWVKDTKDLPSLFKRTNDLVTELGKRPAGIPQDNAKPEEVAAFHKAFGVPEKMEDYKFGEGPKELGPVNVEFQTGMKKVFHEAGVSIKQAAKLEAGYNQLALELTKKMNAVNTQQDVDFDKLKVETFGNRSDEAIKGAQLLIAKFAPEKFKPLIAGMKNEDLILHAAVLDAIRKEYISEDRMPRGGGAPVGMTKEQQRARGQELMASEPYRNQFHPDHDKVKAEVAEIYGTK